MTLGMQISMFHKAHPKDLTQKPFDINHKSARDFGTAIGVILGFFGLFVLVFFWLCFGFLLGTSYATWNIGRELIESCTNIHWVSFWKDNV